MALTVTPPNSGGKSRGRIVKAAGRFADRAVAYGVTKAGRYLFPSSSSSSGRANRKRRRRTSTRRSKGVKTNNVAPSIGNYTYSSFKRAIKGRRYPKMLELIYPPRVDRDVAGSVLENNGAHTTQAVTYYSWADKQSFARPFDILDDASVATVRGYIRAVKGHLEIANLSNCAVQLTLYDIVARRDLQGTDASGESDLPTTAWDEVAATGGGTINDLKSYDNIGATPFDSPEFCQKFKVVRITKAALATGNVHTHYVNIKLNWLLHKEYQQAYNGYKNRTHYTLVVAKGAPMAKTITSGLVHTTVVCPVDLHILKHQSVLYRGINNVQSYYQYDNNLSHDNESGTYSTMVYDVEKVDFEGA